MAGMTSVAVLAAGPGMHTVAGVPAGPLHMAGLGWLRHLQRAVSAHGLTINHVFNLVFTCGAGILVHARPNITLPGYRQHLGQALLGAYDMARDACPDSLRPTYCR